MPAPENPHPNPRSSHGPTASSSSTITNTRIVTPAQKHAGADTAVLAMRAEVYRAAKERHPECWNGRRTRNLSPVRSTTRNPVSQRSLEPIAKRAA